MQKVWTCYQSSTMEAPGMKAYSRLDLDFIPTSSAVQVDLRIYKAGKQLVGFDYCPANV